MGTPAVATSVGAVREMIDASDTRFLVRPRDLDMLATTISEALPRTEEVGRRAATMFRGRYGMADVARQWADVIERTR